MESQTDGEFRLPTGDGMCFAPSKQNVNQPALRAAKSTALLQNVGGAFTGGANPKPTRLASQTRLRPERLSIFFPSSSYGRATNHMPCSHCVVGVEAEDGGRSHLQVLAGPPGRWDAGCLLSCLEL